MTSVITHTYNSLNIMKDDDNILIHSVFCQRYYISIYLCMPFTLAGRRRSALTAVVTWSGLRMEKIWPPIPFKSHLVGEMKV